jgi:hypothetical protein
MCCEPIWSQDTLRTQDDYSTMQRTQIPPLDEISHSTAQRAVMALMAAMAAVMSSTGIRDHGNRTTRRQDTSTGHVRDEYGEQFGRNLGQRCVNTLGGAQINSLG